MSCQAPLAIVALLIPNPVPLYLLAETDVLGSQQDCAVLASPPRSPPLPA